VPPKVTFYTADMIPCTGTWQSAPGEVTKAVQHALSVGYKHIDAAYCYANEDEVGAGIAAALKSGAIKREDLFVTTKLWCTYHTRVEEALDKSLKSLDLDYVDLYLMHWPVAMNPNGNHEKFPKLPDGSRDLSLDRSHIDTYLDMEKLLQTSKVKAIGVCNYSVRYLKALLPKVSVMPAVNQIENHPQLPQWEVVEFCKSRGIHVTAYSPLGSTGSPLMELPEVKAVAGKHKTSTGAILLSYHGMILHVHFNDYILIIQVARGISVLAKSVTPARIEQNRIIVQLDETDISALNKISQSAPKRYVYPEFGVDFGFPDKQGGIVVV